MKPENCCAPCRGQLGQLATADPHDALRQRKLSATTYGTLEIFDCNTCGAELSRNIKAKDDVEHWQLI